MSHVGSTNTTRSYLQWFIYDSPRINKFFKGIFINILFIIYWYGTLNMVDYVHKYFSNSMLTKCCFALKKKNFSFLVQTNVLTQLKEWLLYSLQFLSYIQQKLNYHAKTNHSERMTILIKVDYTRTRASDSKHFPALTHIIFLVNILGLC